MEGSSTSASFSQQPGKWTIIAPDGTRREVDGGEFENVPVSEEPPSIGGPIGSAAGAAAGHYGASLLNAAPATSTALPAAPALLPGFELPTILGSPTLGAAAGYAGIPAGAFVGYQQFKGAKDILKGKNPSLLEHAALFPLTGGLSLAAKPISKMFGSSKDADQLNRDAVRQSLLDNGIIDENYGLTTKDGRTTNIGLDGSTKAYNIDFNRPNAAQAAAWLDPLSAMITGGDEKLRSDFTGYLVNAAYADDPRVLRNNISDLYQRLGVTPDQMDEFIDGSKLPDNVKAIFKQNVNSLTQKDNFGTIGQTPPTAAPPAAQPPVQQKDPNVQKPQAQPQQAPPPPGPPKNLNQIASLMSMQRSKK